MIATSVAASVAGLTACVAGTAVAASLSGAGSTVLAPLEAQWGHAFQKAHGVAIAYAVTGSQVAITDVSSRVVDFGASEAPLTAAQLAGCHSCYQIPWALSAVGIGYHIKGVGSKLRLTGNVLADIYLGQISHWNDPRIQALNPRVRLPARQITPIYSGNFGDAYAFTSYLSAVSATWRKRIGFGATVGLSTGVPVNSAPGIAAMLASTDGAVGYIGASYLIAAGLPAAAIQNAAGNYEYPNLKSIEAAAQTVKRVPAGGAIRIVNPARTARTAYPISTFLYALVPADAHAKSLLKQWILYALGAGQAFGPALDFPALPAAVSSAAKTAVTTFSG